MIWNILGVTDIMCWFYGQYFIEEIKFMTKIFLSVTQWELL